MRRLFLRGLEETFPESPDGQLEHVFAFPEGALRLAKTVPSCSTVTVRKGGYPRRKSPAFPHDSPSLPRKKWKNMKNPSKKCLQNGNIGVIMIDGLFSKGVKRRESKIFRKTDLRKM